MSEHQTEFVPLAQRYQEEIPGYKTDSRETQSQTVWLNPLDHDVVVPIFVGTEPVPFALQFNKDGTRRQLKPEKKSGVRVYVIPKGEKKALPSEYDAAIHQYECKEASCTSKKMYCDDRSHKKHVVGGLCPGLVNMGMQNVSVAPALDDVLQRHTAELDNARMALTQKKAAEDALLVAQQRADSLKVELEAQIAKRLAGDKAEDNDKEPPPASPKKKENR